ncbi:MAG: hypothetical protein ACRCZF_04220, partial [Gemmataceae bacterium]
MWNAITSVNTEYTLLAFIAAVFLAGYCYRKKKANESILAMPEADRLKAMRQHEGNLLSITEPYKVKDRLRVYELELTHKYKKYRLGLIACSIVLIALFVLLLLPKVIISFKQQGIPKNSQLE